MVAALKLFLPVLKLQHMAKILKIITSLGFCSSVCANAAVVVKMNANRINFFMGKKVLIFGQRYIIIPLMPSFFSGYYSNDSAAIGKSCSCSYGTTFGWCKARKCSLSNNSTRSIVSSMFFGVSWHSQMTMTCQPLSCST